MKAISKIAIAAVVSGAMVLPASGALAASKTERAIIGAVLGGVAGAALGNGDGDAVAIGAVAGAALGASTGRSDRRYHRSYRQSRPYYSEAGYRDDRRGYYGSQRYDRYDTRYSYDGYGYRR